MKTTITNIVLIVSLMLLIPGCSKDDETTFLTGTWKVVAYVNYYNSEIITKTNENTRMDLNNGDVIVSFNKTNSYGGTISGSTVTNTFNGTYTVDQNGKITISSLVTTLVNEPDWGLFFFSIQNAEAYEIKNGLLIIYFNQKKNSINLQKI